MNQRESGLDERIKDEMMIGWSQRRWKG